MIRSNRTKLRRIKAELEQIDYVPQEHQEINVHSGLFDDLSNFKNNNKNENFKFIFKDPTSILLQEQQSPNTSIKSLTSLTKTK